MLGKLNETEEKAVKEFRDILLERFGENIKMIRLFGSKARGDYTTESDIDVLIYVKAGDFKLRSNISDITSKIFLKHEVLISPIIVNEKDFSELIRLQMKFIRNVEKEGVDIWKARS